MAGMVCFTKCRSVSNAIMMTNALGKLQDGDSAPQLWGLLHDGDSYAQNPFCYVVQRKPL